MQEKQGRDNRRTQEVTCPVATFNKKGPPYAALFSIIKLLTPIRLRLGTQLQTVL